MLFFLVEIVYDVIPVFYEEIEESLVLIFGRGAAGEGPGFCISARGSAATWTRLPTCTRRPSARSCARHHALIVNRYFLEAQRLAEKLTSSRAAHARHPAARV